MPLAQSGVAPEWAIPESVSQSHTSSVSDIYRREFFTDPNLTGLIDLALENNRDLRIAMLNVKLARAEYGIQRADRIASVNAGLSNNRAGGSNPQSSESYTAQLQLSQFELDLFGRVKNLSEAALQTYLATEEAQRSARILLVSEVASAYLNLAADREQLRIARASQANLGAYVELIAQQYQLGAVSELDVQLARSGLEQSRADSARAMGLIAQDRSALSLLIGAGFDTALLPETFGSALSESIVLPALLPSTILLQRPDILQAERNLRAANANIGAARAAFFPAISLTGSVGTASSELSGLFDAGTSYWSFVPQLSVPIFQGGRLKAGLGVAEAKRDIALAEYEKAIQFGFSEVADALALSQTLSRQRLAQEAVLNATTRVYQLSKARYELGRASYIVLLDAQQTLYDAEQSLLAIQLAEQRNRVTLYKVLGGGSK